MIIQEIRLPEHRRQIARTILEMLPEWFGLPESRESYIAQSGEQTFLAALEGERPLGFLSLKETGRETLELAVMGVDRHCHRQGIGRALVLQAQALARMQGYALMQVKTVQMGCSAVYDRTNRFYRAMGFLELEVFPTLWDAWNPCQVYVLVLGQGGRMPAEAAPEDKMCA